MDARGSQFETDIDILNCRNHLNPVGREDFALR